MEEPRDYPELHWTPQQVQAFWDFNSRYQDRYFTFHKGLGIMKRFRPHLEGRREILDYGCGLGHLLHLLLDAGYQAGGVDYSNESVKSVTERFAGNPRFLGAWEPHGVEAEGRRFDAVIATEVVEHLYDDVLDETLDRIRSLLAPGGIAIFTTPNEERLENNWLFCPQCEHVYHRHQHVRSWSGESLGSRLEERGFEVVDRITTDFVAAFFRHNRQKWRAIRKTIKYTFKPHAKRPHLMVIGRAAPAANIA